MAVHEKTPVALGQTGAKQRVSDDDPGSAEFSIFEDPQQSSDRRRLPLYTGTDCARGGRRFGHCIGHGSGSGTALSLTKPRAMHQRPPNARGCCRT